ncbi:unnamed protein product [Cylicocyclus nassatus]|uniref:Lipoprotein n=1 Tax=Cylicocyclus nassatus TaxID=53992 RepID=A0AA36M034_CYLNA|nr:unnamed protein product [Cylicocyclus nassatus]
MLTMQKFFKVYLVLCVMIFLAGCVQAGKAVHAVYKYKCFYINGKRICTNRPNVVLL